MGDKTQSRRQHLVQLGLGASALAVAPALHACGGKKKEEKLTCTDTTGLSPAEVEQRESAEYTDESPHERKKCDNCNWYKVASPQGSCGGCTLLKGPIHPKGYCTLWAEKQSG